MSSLTTSSPQFLRPGGSNGTFYYQTIQVTVSASSTYILRSFSALDTYGYLYINSFSPQSPSTNRIAENDDSAGGTQFQIMTSLEPNAIYILVVTTYYSNSLGNFTVLASGISRVTLQTVQNITTTTISASTTTRIPSSSTTTSS